MTITKPNQGATGWHVAVNQVIDWVNSYAFSIKDFGAVGDGTTDDYEAIQDALDAAADAPSGAVVYGPPGDYLTSKYLLAASNTTLAGAGMGMTTLRAASTLRSVGGTAPDGGGYSLIQATGSTRENITIRDLTIDGNESADRAALAASGVRMNSFLVDMREVTGLRIERVATRNTWTYNLAVLDSEDVVVTGCDVQSPNTTGVYDQLDGIHIWGSTRVRVLGNYVDNGIGGDADDGLVCRVFSGGTSSSDVVFSGNVVRGGPNGHGLQIAGDTTATITGVTVTGNTFWGSERGVRLAWFSGSGGGAIRSIVIADNAFRDMTVDRPIQIIAGGGGRWDDVAITGNVIDGYGSAADEYAPGIYVAGGNSSRGIVIANNSLRDGYGAGIELAEDAPVRDYSITGNTIDMSAAAVAPFGLSLISSLDGTVIGNIITGPGTGAGNGEGIYLSATSGAGSANQTLSGNRVRGFTTGVQVSNAQGANPTNTLFTNNNTQGNGTATAFGSATVTSANNL